MKKLSKGWKIFIITTVVLISSIYGYHKINNRNAFEEMYNSYYNILSIKSIDNIKYYNMLILNIILFCVIVSFQFINKC